MDQPHIPSFSSAMLFACITLVSLQSAGCDSAGTPIDATQQTQPDRGLARDISDVELLGLMSERPDLLLIDVRTAQEWDGGHIAGACLLDFLEDDFSERAKKLPKDRPIALYCAAGGRSEDAMSFLAKSGFKEVYNLRGGFYGWEDAGRDISNDPAVALPAE
jgi:rhodanese-related sulfurtransferase